MAKMSAKKDSHALFTHGPKTGPCSVCGKAGAQACSRCRMDFYCAREHQTQDWPRHRKGCGVLALRSDSQVGRHVVATKDIPAGTLLMREVPLVVYPKVSASKPVPVCVGCYKILYKARSCSKCGWPVCSESCSKQEVHIAECAAFQRAKFKISKTRPPKWDALAALRVCLASQADQSPGPGATLRDLQADHPPPEDAFRDVPDEFYQSMQQLRQMFTVKCAEAVRWLTDEVGISWLPADDLRRAAGSCFLNSITASTMQSVSASGIFAGVSLLEHSCSPNAHCNAWSDAGQSMDHVVVATRDIRRGEHISITYRNGVLQGAIVRRLDLLWWGFLCRCALCVDPRQGGLHLDGWCCGVCSTPTKVHPVLVDAARWFCPDCGRQGSMLDDEHVQDAAEADPSGSYRQRAETTRLARCVQEMLDHRVSRAAWIRFIDDAMWPRGPLHATHHLVLQAKEKAVNMYGEDVQDMVRTMSEDEVRRVCEFCRDLLAVSAVARPGRHHPFYKDLTRRLYELTAYRFMACTKAIVDQPQDRPRLLAAAKVLEKELIDLLSKLKISAVSPLEKRNAEKTAQELDGVRFKFPLLLQMHGISV